VIEIEYILCHGDKTLTSNLRYVSYLMRLQQVQAENKLTWVASMQCIKTGELICFENLDTLILFIQQEYGNSNRPSELQSIEKCDFFCKNSP